MITIIGSACPSSRNYLSAVIFDVYRNLPYPDPFFIYHNLWTIVISHFTSLSQSKNHTSLVYPSSLSRCSSSDALGRHLGRSRRHSAATATRRPYAARTRPSLAPAAAVCSHSARANPSNSDTSRGPSQIYDNLPVTMTKKWRTFMNISLSFLNHFGATRIAIEEDGCEPENRKIPWGNQ